jgi:uncharacterized protein YceK
MDGLKILTILAVVALLIGAASVMKKQEDGTKGIPTVTAVMDFENGF